MKSQFISQKTDLKKVVLAALTASLILAPLAAQADPPDQAPAYGWRKDKNKKDKHVIRDRDRDGYDDRDRDRDGDLDEEDGFDYRNTPGYHKEYGNDHYDNNSNDDRNNFVTLNGYVTRDLNGDSFQMRTDDGRTVRVELSGKEPRELRDGSRVRVSGRLNDNVVRRATVSVLSGGYNNGGGYGNYNQRVTLRGVVTRDLRGNRFEMRQGNTTYFIVLTRNEPRRLSSGDRVEISGRVIKTNYIQADTLRILRDNNYGDNDNGNRINVDFPGRVLDVVNRRLVVVRGDNGTTYQVRSNFDFDSRISTGDRVRVTGTGFRGSRNVDARRIELRDDNNGNNNNDNYNDGDRVDFRGIVRGSSNQLFVGRVITIDGDDGRTYKVRSGDTSFRSGDRVRVRGTVKNGFVTNVDINRL